MKKTMIILAVILMANAGLIKAQSIEKSKTKVVYEFPALPYAYDALEKAVDKETMEIHHDRHFKGYFDKFLKAIEGTDLEYMPIEEIFAHMSKYPDAVRNNAGGFYNHELFFNIMGPVSGNPEGRLAEAIDRDFGSLDAFKKEFEAAAASQFGSGWAWLSINDNGKLFVSHTPNQDNPLMDIVAERGTPILGLDVWEHAYYLRYQNKRTSYIGNFWSVVNWKEVEKLYEKATK